MILAGFTIDRTRKTRTNSFNNFFNFLTLKNRKKKMAQEFRVMLIETLSKNYNLPIVRLW